MPQTPAEYEAAIAEEYGQFIAVAPINFDGVLAYQVGAPVPASNVKKYGYLDQGLVAKTNTKAAQKAVTGEGA
jgi:hypothetical protein